MPYLSKGGMTDNTIKMGHAQKAANLLIAALQGLWKNVVVRNNSLRNTGNNGVVPIRCM
jgi:hypothetical protein